MKRRTLEPALVLFLDIDGVLAPASYGAEDAEALRIGGWHGTVVISPSVIARLKGLHDVGLVEVQWLTAWEDDAASEFAPRVGLGEYRVHIEPATTPAGAYAYWKEQVVRDHAATHPRFIWVDDEATMHGSVDSVARDFPDGLVIAPDFRVGLTHEQVDQIEAYARR